jgi:hypothetical protein
VAVGEFRRSEAADRVAKPVPDGEEFVKVTEVGWFVHGPGALLIV